MNSTWPPDSVSIRMPPWLPPWLVKPAPIRSMYHGTFCIESVPPWTGMMPPPPRMYACRLANSTALSVAVPLMPTVEFITIVLYCLSVSRSRNGLVGSETPAGAWRPGLAPMFGSQISTSKPFCVAELLDHPLVVDDRLVAEAAGAAADEHLVGRVRVGPERDRVVEHAQRLGARVGRADRHAGAARVDGRAVDLGDQRVGRAGQGGSLPAAVLNCCSAAIAPALLLARPACASASSVPCSSLALAAVTIGRGLAIGHAGRVRLRQRRAEEDVHERGRGARRDVLLQRRAELDLGRREVALDGDELLVRARADDDRLADDRAVAGRRLRAGRAVLRVAREADLRVARRPPPR